jgi:SAM-dependent methyltransferase
MSGYDETTYGESIADEYDDLYGTARPAAIDMLAKLAGSGLALELGIGTGRMALPLAERGIAVSGIESSPAMVEKLRAQPFGDKVDITLGDFSLCAAPGQFELIYVVTNTLFCLTKQDDQVACFRNVAARLTDDGVFVVSAYVPNMTWWTNGQGIEIQDISLDRVWIEASRHHAVTQTVDCQYLIIEDGSVRLHPVRVRYVWPSEMDLMARLAGLRLRHRYGGWSRERFTAGSSVHVSIYERDPNQ